MYYYFQSIDKEIEVQSCRLFNVLRLKVVKLGLILRVFVCGLFFFLLEYNVFREVWSMNFVCVILEVKVKINV